MGIKNGLAGIDTSPVDWRGPVADRMYLPSADGGRTITNSANETYFLVNAGRRLAGESAAWPKAEASPLATVGFILNCLAACRVLLHPKGMGWVM